MCDCILNINTVDRLVCVEDCNGTCVHPARYDDAGWITDVAWSHETAYWADCDPTTHTTHFRGDWSHIPHLHSETVPAEHTLWEHSTTWDGHCLMVEKEAA